MKQLTGTIATLVLLAGCGGDFLDEGEVMGACEHFADQKFNANPSAIEHAPAGDIEISGDDPYTMQSAVSLAGGPWLDYTCTVEKTDEGKWRLVKFQN